MLSSQFVNMNIANETVRTIREGKSIISIERL